MRLSKENLSRLHKEFNNTREFKIQKGNKYNILRLVVVNDYYLVSLFNDNTIEFSSQYGDEHEIIYQNATIDAIIDCIKMDKLLLPFNISR